MPPYSDGMESTDDLTQIHLTRLFGWVVNTVGRALLIGAVCFAVPLVFGAGAYAVVVGFAGLAIYLWTANAPMPLEFDEDLPAR